MKQDKLYYNTEYRKKIKALSRFNIFIKDRISKKDVIHEVRLKKKKNLLGPIIYKNLFKLYKLIKNVYNKWVYKITYNLKLSLSFFLLSNIKKIKKIDFFFKNQLILEYFFNGIIYFFLIINWLWVNEWTKWASLTDILEYSFFSIDIIFKYINNYFTEFMPYLFKVYKPLLYGFFYDMNLYHNNISLYNIYAYNSLNIFFALYNVEEFKLEHEKNFVKKEKWKDIRKTSFSYLKLDLLNDIRYTSFFSFVIYDFYLMFSECNSHYLTLTFFEYWTQKTIETNYFAYSIIKNKKKKEDYKFKFNNLNNLYIKIFRKNFYSIRVNYSLFLSNIDYYIFIKDLTYNFYIRNCDHFFQFISQRKYFLRYNNPASTNRGPLTMWDYDKLYKKLKLFPPNNINADLNLFNIARFEPLYSFHRRKLNADENYNYIINSFAQDFNIKLLHKLNKSNHFFSSINKFYDFNLIDFYNIKNRMESYKDVMAIKSVYEYRFANSSFKTMDEFMLTIFKTPLENYLYFEDSYKNFSYNIIFNIFKNVERNYFFKNFFHFYNKNSIAFFSNFLKFFGRLFKIRTYFFHFGLLWNFLKNEASENLLRIDVFSRFYDIFENKKIFFLAQKIKKKMFYKKWSIQKFFDIVKYNSMFYLDINSMFILFSGWIYEMSFYSRLVIFSNIYDKLIQLFNFYEYYKYLMSFKDFFFQLMYENVEYCLILIFMNIKKLNISNNFSFLNKRNKIINNFIYRKYMFYTWLEYRYYDDLFDDLIFFEKGAYSEKLSKWILRYFYSKFESQKFYSESLNNNYINKNRIFL